MSFDSSRSSNSRSNSISSSSSLTDQFRSAYGSTLEFQNKSHSASYLATEPDLSTEELPPSWDLDRPQKAFTNLLIKEQLPKECSVLEVGCGTGEHLLLLAELGFRKCVGIDLISAALNEANKKAKARGVARYVQFVKQDALDLDRWARVFDIVIDVGFFHYLSPNQREVYVNGLANSMTKGGVLYMICISAFEPIASDKDREDRSKIVGARLPEPFHITPTELRSLFTPDKGWEIERMIRDYYETRVHPPPGASAFVVRIKRTESTEKTREFGEVRIGDSSIETLDWGKLGLDENAPGAQGINRPKVEHNVEFPPKRT